MITQSSPAEHTDMQEAWEKGEGFDIGDEPWPQLTVKSWSFTDIYELRAQLEVAERRIKALEDYVRELLACDPNR